MTNGNTAIELWGEQDELVTLGERLRVLLPNGQSLTPEQAMALAQYSKLADANPFRGEIYAVPIRGQMQFVEGYKLLVRWAKRTEPYNDKYEEWSEEEKVRQGLKADDIAYTCFILLEKDKKTMLDFVRAGNISLKEAYEFFAFSATGVVTRRGDMVGQNNNPISPPKGWTWHDVAKKRALKNAINLSHGAPSPKEIAHESWMIDSTETIDSDWAEVPATEGEEVRERYAKLAAHTREVLEDFSQLSPEERREKREDNVNLLRGKYQDVPIGEEPEEVLVESDEIKDVAPIQSVDNEEYLSRKVSLEEARVAILRGYKTEISVQKAISNLLGFNSLQELDEIWLWNFYQYSLRREILNNVNIPLDQRLSSIPELAETTQPIKTLKAAGEFLHETLKVLCANNTRMRRLESDNSPITD